VVALIAYAAGMFAGGGLLASWVASADAPLAVRIVGVALLVLVAAHGGHMLGFIGHEGVHLMLARNKYVSILVGAFFSAMTSFAAIGYGIAHWNHHRFTNQESDPDAHLYAQFRTFWSRALKARTTGSRSHQKNLVNIALGRPLQFGYKLPFSARAQRVLAWVNLGMLLFWLVVYGTVAYVSPTTALFAIVLPFLLLLPMSGLRGYIEHAGTGIGAFRDTRSYASPVFTVLFFGNNFHLEHHLYPGVPCYRLPAVHRFLRERGYFQGTGVAIEDTVLGALRHTTAGSQYPDPSAPDSADDPFVASTPRSVPAAA
jgi:fatty acid desaturase